MPLKCVTFCLTSLRGLLDFFSAVVSVVAAVCDVLPFKLSLVKDISVKSRESKCNWMLLNAHSS